MWENSFVDAWILKSCVVFRDYDLYLDIVELSPSVTV